jgi:hypothetical protein
MADVLVLVACGALLLYGIVRTVRGQGNGIAPPAADGTAAGRLRVAVWWLGLVVLTGVVSGLTVVGPAARLAMRLLGATAGDAAQGRLTEAEEVVGEISLGGTIGLLLFAGIVFGLATSILWFVARGVLPTGRVGGVVLGAVVLVLAATRVDPLRPDNEDFDLVGPWWLAIALFTAMALLQGAAVAAFAPAISRWLPLPGRSPRTLAYAALIFLLPLLPVAILAALVLAVVAWAPEPVRRVPVWLADDRVRRAGQVVLALLVLVALPGFVQDIADIAGRGPGG